MPQATLQDDLQTFFNHFALAWAQADKREIMRFLKSPIERQTSAKRSVVEDEEAAEDALDALMRRFEEHGIASARIATIEMGAVTDATVDVTVHWELLNEDTEPVMAYDVGYTLGREGAHDWRIVAIQEDEQNRAFADAGWLESDAA